MGYYAAGGILADVLERTNPLRGVDVRKGLSLLGGMKGPAGWVGRLLGAEVQLLDYLHGKREHAPSFEGLQVPLDVRRQLPPARRRRRKRR